MIDYSFLIYFAEQRLICDCQKWSKMGIQDFEAMYDSIDLKRKGYITAEQIQHFCETLYYSPVCVQHVEYAIRDTCGASGMVTRKEFLDVFVEIERRRATEEQAYWDFQVRLHVCFSIDA